MLNLADPELVVLMGHWGVAVFEKALQDQAVPPPPPKDQGGPSMSFPQTGPTFETPTFIAPSALQQPAPGRGEGAQEFGLAPLPEKRWSTNTMETMGPIGMMGNMGMMGSMGTTEPTGTTEYGLGSMAKPSEPDLVDSLFDLIWPE